MAILQGISGLQWGDGASGQVALSIHTEVLRILRSNKLSYMSATLRTPGQVQTGTATYYVPEIVQTNYYGAAGSSGFSIPQTGLVSFNLDKRRDAKWEVEQFDIARLQDSTYILSVIAAGLAGAIQNDLNAEYLAFLSTQFKEHGALNNVTNGYQVVDVPTLWKTDVNVTPEECRKDFLLLQQQVIKFTKKFNKKMLGLERNEVFAVLSYEADINLRNAFWNQPNELGRKVIEETLEGQQLGLLKYFTDPMLQNNIPAGTSFSKDTALNTENFVGFIAHKEAIAFPINLMTTTQTINPDNGNPRFITKYQFGMGILRPELIVALRKKSSSGGEQITDNPRNYTGAGGSQARSEEAPATRKIFSK